MKKIILLFFLLSFYSCQQFDKNKNTIYLIGDSTMSEKLPHKRPETGWGEMLNEFFEAGIKIENYAKNGRSSRSFIAEKRWETIVEKLQEGDVVFIQFGHNDTKKTADRFSSPEQYGENLRLFIKSTQAKKATPVLLTSIVRRRFDEEGKFYDTHGKYPNVVREIAKNQNITLIDLHKRSEQKMIEMGATNSKSLFLFLEKGEHPNYPDGKEDNTHFSPKGATIIAEIVVDEIRKSSLPIRKFLTPMP